MVDLLAIGVFGADISTLKEVTEFDEERLAEFRAAGAAPEYTDERVFDGGDDYNFLDLDGWMVTIATHEDKIYKVALAYQTSKANLKNALDHCVSGLAKKYGKPKHNIFNKSKYEWRADGVHLYLMFRVPAGYDIGQINLLARSS